MTRPARLSLVAGLALCAATLAAPAYLALDAIGRVPVAVRDRPWPFVVLAIACAIVAARRAPRLRFVALAIALVSSGATAAAAHYRYRLPPASASAGVNQPWPELELRDQSGQEIKLRADDRPLLLIWFRGAWCPYCRRQLAELSAELARTGGAGVRTLAVAPDPPEPLRALKDELKLPFPLISDPERKLFNRCELAHCVAISDGKGIVRWGVVSGNWEKDLPARALVQAAYRLE